MHTLIIRFAALAMIVTLSACGGGNSAGPAPSSPVPTATLSAASSSVNNGDTTTLTWSSTNATACQASGGWSGSLPASGSESTAALTTSTTYSLVCSGAGGASPTAAVTVNVLPAVTLTANPTTVTAGGASTLTWSSTNATACQASGGWSGALAVSGSQSTGAVSSDTVYTLTCSGAAGNSAPVSATVAVAVGSTPTAALSAAPTTIASGGSSTLTWSSTGATACTASGAWSGALAASGTQSTGALTANASYSLTCTGAGGTSAPALASVTVAPLPTVALSAAPSTVASGASSTLTWSSTAATSCTASGAWSGTLAASGSRSTGALTANASYSLTCSGLGGTSAPAMTTVMVAPMPTASLSATPSTVVSGASSTLTWSSTGATGCTASGSWSGALAVNGSQSTGPLTTAASYSILCTGTGGSSATQTVSVSIAGAALSPKMATIGMTQTVQFATTLGGAVLWSVDGMANGNATAGTVSSTGLYTAGTTAGQHTIVATSSADATQTQSGVAAVTDLTGVYTYHNDNARSGANTHEYALSPANVSTATFGKLASCAVDGAIYTQPLWVSNLTIGGAPHNVVLVGTQHDGLYAFDADAAPCVTLWHVSLIDVAHGAAAAGEVPVPAGKVGVGAGDISPEIGVTGTPVIDPATNILYVVSKSMDSGLTTFFTRLHAIDLFTGNEKTGSPAVVAGTYPGTGSGGSSVAFDSKQELERGGLGLLNGNVYVAFGSHEDDAPWYGWLFTYRYSGTALTQSGIFNATPNTGKGGIWMGGGAPAFDATNNAYFVTGNGTFDATNSGAPNNDYGDTLLALTPSLTVAQYYTPADELSDNDNDQDFGAGGSTMLADLPAGSAVTHALVCGGKDGTLVVLNRDALGGYDGVKVQSIVLNHPIYSTATFWNNNMFVAGGGDLLKAFTLNTATAQFTQASGSRHTFGFPGATAAVSAAAAQGGIVWSIETNAYCTAQSHFCGPAIVFANDASNLASELWNSSTLAADQAGNAVKFSVPTVANGHVYVGTRGNNTGGAENSTSTPGELEIYGLKP